MRQLRVFGWLAVFAGLAVAGLGCGDDSSPTAAVDNSDAAQAASDKREGAATTGSGGSSLDWSLCSTRFAFDDMLAAAPDGKTLAEQLRTIVPPPSLRDAFVDAIRIGEGGGDTDEMWRTLDADYQAMNAAILSPCDAAGLGDNFGCVLVDDCARAFAKDPSDRSVAAPSAIRHAAESDDPPVEVDSCYKDTELGQTCEFRTKSGLVTGQAVFGQTTTGRWYLLGI